MQKIAPQQYKKYCEMMAESLAQKDYTLLIKAMKYMMDWEQRAYKENPQPFEEEKQKQVEWKRNMENTRLEKPRAPAYMPLCPCSQTVI